MSVMIKVTEYIASQFSIICKEIFEVPSTLTFNIKVNDFDEKYRKIFSAFFSDFRWFLLLKFSLRFFYRKN